MAKSGSIKLFPLFLIAAAIALTAGCSKDSSSTTGPTVNPAPVLTSVNSAIFTVGKEKTFTFTASGSPAPKFSLLGTLPTGLTFTDTTGVLKGTAGAGTSGTYPLAIVASNGYFPNAADNFTLSVSKTVLILHDPGAGTLDADVVSSLSAKITAAGLTPTAITITPTGPLTGYAQVWDVRFNNIVLTNQDSSTYAFYLISGGSLFLIGENSGFAKRDSSIGLLISGLGGGNITLKTPNNRQIIQPPLTGPNAIDTVVFQASCGTADPGRGAFAAKDSNNVGAAILFQPGALLNAPAGRLVVVYDINFLMGSADAALQKLVANMIALP